MFYHIHLRALSCIVYDFGVSNRVITQKIIVIGPCNLLIILRGHKWNWAFHIDHNMSTLMICLDQVKHVTFRFICWCRSKEMPGIEQTIEPSLFETLL